MGGGFHLQEEVTYLGTVSVNHHHIVISANELSYPS